MCINENHLNPLVVKSEDGDNFYLYCLECNYKLNPGINLYEELIEKIYYEKY